MITQTNDIHGALSVTRGSQIVELVEQVNLDIRGLYQAVIDLASEGLITSSAINMAAGILLKDLGLPNYFFENLQQTSLKGMLASIATSMAVNKDRVFLTGRVANIDFSLEHENALQKVRIATQETRDSMETMLNESISGHRREYYYNPESQYYTYIARPETVNFLTVPIQDHFTLDGDIRQAEVHGTLPVRGLGTEALFTMAHDLLPRSQCKVIGPTLPRSG